MKIKISYISFVILLLALGFILVDFGPSTSILGDKNSLLAEKQKLKAERETVEIRVDSLSNFINCICRSERLDCSINSEGKNLVFTFPIAQSRSVESAFLCGLDKDELKGRLNFSENDKNLIFSFPIKGEFATLPSIFPACLPSKRKLCND